MYLQIRTFRQKQSAKAEVLRITSLSFPLGDRDIGRLVKAADLSGLSTEDLSDILNISYATASSSTGVVEKSDCKYNAKSPHLRCAVNPCGSCESCKYFEV
ncbi:hypothetical protein WA1_19090 [Scytonema hofmannii PCC 7110]|uniref:Uncharacterized protein n=2 Tax=Scytonema hofmannii TaxID=34078 RepID=A0A139XBM6_9CYAN|nr:hypothetical protein WA1_19090 [Scytonema hofmannii PCC 7110]